MAMAQMGSRSGGGKGKGKGKGKFGGRKRDGDERPMGGFRGSSKYTPKLLGKAYFQRKKGCPFSGPKAPKIDYKDVRLLGKYLSDYGKMLPRHLTGVCAGKQRELAQAIKRARMLALLSFTVKEQGRFGEDRPERGDRPGFRPRGDRGERPAPRTTEGRE
jgi:small subunit ribosomal protein S18